MKYNHISLLAIAAVSSLPSFAVENNDSTGSAWLGQEYNIGVELRVNRLNSTASVGVIDIEKDVNQRSAKNIANTLIGHGQGLITIAGSGTYAAQNPTFYVRGLQSLSGSAPLILVDGIERDITMIDPDEVKEVQILKDAAATAIYGYKGSDGVINVITKRGSYNSQVIRVNYEHIFSNMTHRPRFIDAPTYASAMNEALYNEGHGMFAKYSQDEINAFASGQYPTLYPNVDWVGETFRRHAHGDRASFEFSGGGEKFRYFTMGSLVYSDGFIKSPNRNNGYSTQDKYTRGSLRINLDVDLWKYTMLHTNVFTSISEMQAPGANVNLWDMIAKTPSAAFPVMNERNMWGGNSTWSGDNNAFAQSTDAGYFKIFNRQLFFDAAIEQDLGMVTSGLKFNIGASYDVNNNIEEDHSRKYNYGMTPVSGWENGEPVAGNYWEVADQQTALATGHKGKTFGRRFNAWSDFTYDRIFGEHHHLMTQLKYHYDYEDPIGLYNTFYRHNISWWGQYTLNNRWTLGITLVESGSSRLAPGTKWNFSPTVSAGAVIFNNHDAKVNFLKARASWGKINLDRIPDGNGNYYATNYTTTGVGYPFDNKYDPTGNWGETRLDRIPTKNPTTEKVDKYDVGVDATLFGCLNLTADYFYNRHYDIFVDGSGLYSNIIGFSAPYLNKGEVKNQGVDISIDFSKQFGDLTVMAGGSFLLSKNKIVDMLEEPRAYKNLVQTGNPLSSTYGLVAAGVFTSEQDIQNWPTQTFSDVRPGDIKYLDLNGDKKIDDNDVTMIGYNPVCPEIFYTFNLGAEYKGLGLVAHFQGTGRYGCNLSSSGYYWGLINNTSLAQEVYDNRWSPENNVADARYPRLSSVSNSNNYRTSTFWQRDRSYLKLRTVELYYNFKSNLLAKTHFIKGARLYVRGIDLFSIATGGKNKLKGLDPEATGLCPTSRQVVVGTKLTF